MDEAPFKDVYLLLFLEMRQEKLSKSLGNSPDFDLFDEFGTDAVVLGLCSCLLKVLMCFFKR